MTAAERRDHTRVRGVVLPDRGGRLGIDGPEAAAELLTERKARKEALLAFLRVGPASFSLTHA